MGVKGFQGTSLLDYPGHIASLVFFGDCNLSCPFCHNPALVQGSGELQDYPLPALLEQLERRRSFIDGVVVSGGEPTLSRQLLPFLRSLKGLGLLVKLDSNGLKPAVLKKVIWEGLADRIALDLKTAPARYVELHDGPVEAGALLESIALLQEGGVEVEYRTTCVPGLVGPEELLQLGALIQGAPNWVLQQFVPRYCMDPAWREVSPYTDEQLEALAEVARQYVPQVTLRGL
jgi:pyruvate formate lyase activating enzyme